MKISVEGVLLKIAERRWKSGSAVSTGQAAVVGAVEHASNAMRVAEVVIELQAVLSVRSTVLAPSIT
jgi:hypothetical protein